MGLVKWATFYILSNHAFSVFEEHKAKQMFSSHLDLFSTLSASFYWTSIMCQKLYKRAHSNIAKKHSKCLSPKELIA